MTSAIELSIVVVNYNTRMLILDCIASILQHAQGLSIEIIIIDNASTDGSADAIRQHYPEVRLIANEKNVYFSAANNQGIKAAQGKYVLVLNPDTIIQGNTLGQLVEYMIKHDTVGAATTTMFFPDGKIQRNGSRNVTFGYLIYQYTFIGKLLRTRTQMLNNWLWYDTWDRKSEQEVGVLPGSVIIAERKLWLNLNGFREEMLLYFSDDYFSISTRQLGKKTMYVPTDGIIHYENASTKQSSRRALNIYFRDLLAYIYLVFGRSAQIIYFILLIPTWTVQFLKAK